MRRPNVGVGYGEIGRPVLAFEAYRQWAQFSEEAGKLIQESTTADFATYLSNVVNKVYFEQYGTVESNWREWADTLTVNDYSEITSVGLEGFPALLRVEEAGEYKAADLGEVVGPKIRVHKYGRTFSLTREVIINDDLNRMREIPAMMGRAGRETLDDAVIDALENPGNAYDGEAFFNNTTHDNLITDALSETSLQTAYTKLRTKTDSLGRRIGLRPGTLLTPVDLDFTAARILNSTEITQPGTGTTAAYGQGNANVVRGLVRHISDHHLNDTNNWYLFAEPAGRPAFRVAFLNGLERPQVMLREPYMRYVLGGVGGADPYTFSFDEIWWKVRFEFGVAPWEWRSVVKSNVA